LTDFTTISARHLLP